EDSSVSCTGFSDGGATASGTGGTAPYSYTWSNSATTASITGVVAGTYSVTITDNNGCTDSASVVVAAATALVASTTVTNTLACFGDANGAGSASITGGTSPYTYQWSNANTTQSINALLAGTYTVTISDNNGCSVVDSLTITQPTAVSPAAVVDSNVSCNGGTDGGATVSATGGTGPYTFAWSNGATGTVASGLSSGNYTVTVTDNNGCTATDNVTITEPTAVVAQASIDSNASCFSFSDGGATATASGGTAPYSYAWSNSAITASITGVVAATYSVTITDANGCTDSASVTISEPNLLVATAVEDSSVSCSGFSDGGASASASGGTGAYTYLWSNLATTASITGVMAGTYSVTITDANGCTDSASITVAAATALVPSVSTTASPLCFGDATGAMTASISGGTAPYTYLWSNGGTNASISNLTAGTYSVTIADNNGCSVSDSATITEPAMLVPVAVVDSNVSCNGLSDGGASVTVSGGTGAYTYLWSNSATTSSITGVIAGTYTVTVTDANGCTSSDSIFITEPVVLVASIMETSPVLCNGDANGELAAVVSGGTFPYTYSWSTGVTTDSLSGLVAGVYALTVTDANGCEDTNSYILTQPALLAGIASADSMVSCNGLSDGGATAAFAGGTAPYTYLWSNGATTASSTGLAAANYTVTVTDNNGCTALDSVAITEPAVLVATSQIDTSISCNGDSNAVATGLATGGTMPYTFLWSNGANTATVSGLGAGLYQLTVVDANGCTDSTTLSLLEPAQLMATATVDSNVLCNGDSTGGLTVVANGGTPPYNYLWSNGDTTASISGVTAGVYDVTITDANGCTTTSGGVVTEPTQLIASAVVDSNATCNGLADGGASVSATGGTGAYTYLWSNSATTSSITGVVSGTYSITVTDANGCTDSTSITITSPISLISSAVVDSNATCAAFANGGATSSANGGTQPYTYQWSNAASTASITGVMAGTYSVTITDNNGCSDSSSVTITEPNALTIALVADSMVSCNGLSDGGASVAAMGGTLPYSWLWSNADTSTSITGLIAGSYTVTLTDGNGCSAVDSIVITEPMAISFTLSGTDLNCAGDSNGSAQASVNGGTPPYNYLWSNGDTGSLSSGLIAGTYILTVTDSSGCGPVVDSITINEPAPLALASTVNNVSCFGDTNGAVTLNISGGTAPYAYNWSTGDTTASLSGLLAGNYSVTVTDSLGCMDTLTATVVEPSALGDTILSSFNPSCVGAMDGSIAVSGTGGTAPYSYLWSTGDTTANISGLSAGTYTVIITDTQNCGPFTDSIVLVDPPVITGGITGSSNVSCNGDSSGTAVALGSGGTGTISYLWSNGDTTDSVSNLPAGTYFVSISDSNNCGPVVDSVTITQPNALVLSLSNQVNVSCNGDSSGMLQVGVVGGVTPYTYLWSNGDTTDSVSGLLAGTYVVTVTDSNGCTDTLSASILEPLALVLSDTVSDVTCNGDTNGSISLDVSGGTAPYTYNWSNGDTTQVLNNLAGGSYTVTVTDANGCSDTLTSFVDEPLLLVAAIGATTDNFCFGDSTGSLSVIGNGGTLPYTYLWSNGDTDSTANGLPAGTYTVTLTDANGCSDTASASVVAPSPLNAVVNSVTDNQCANDSSGSITLTVGGGTFPYSYLWSNGDTSSTISGLAAGGYTVTVSDANGCTTETDTTVFAPNAIVITLDSVVDVVCNGDSNGSIAVSATGGSSPLSYLWNTGDTTSMLSNLLAGIYTVTVTDQLGCSDSLTGIVVSQPAALSGVATITPVQCFGETNGSATLQISGGTAPYSINWFGVDSSNLAVGSYPYTVTDSLGCSFSDSVVVTQPDSITVAEVITPESSAGASDGAESLTTTGGTSPYTYNWSAPGGSSSTLSGLVAGTYTVTVTDSNNCSKVVSYEVPVVIGIAPLTEVSKWNVFPNPARRGATLTWEHYRNATATVELYDMAGQVVQRLELPEPGNYPLDLQGISTGVYFVRMVSEGEAQTLRLIVE
ncbi:MAG: T9SS type A sorting domain-containing protein, partial [Salibacteraceae bacterium]